MPKSAIHALKKRQRESDRNVRAIFREKERGEVVLPPTTLLSGVAASQYLDISRRTLYSLITRGHLITHDTPEGKRFRVSDLDKAKLHIGKYGSKRDAPLIELGIVARHDPEKAIEENRKLLASVKATEASMTDDEQKIEVDDVLAKMEDRMVKMADKADFVAEVFAMLQSPVESTKVKGISLIQSFLEKRNTGKEKLVAPWEVQLDELDKVIGLVNRDYDMWARTIKDQDVLPPIEG